MAKKSKEPRVRDIWSVNYQVMHESDVVDLGVLWVMAATPESACAKARVKQSDDVIEITKVEHEGTVDVF